MRKYRYALGAILGVLLTVLAVVVISLKTQQVPRVTDIGPLALGIGTSLVAWWLQGLISALLARPKLGHLRIWYMFRVYLAGAFIGGISPVRGAEIPYEVYMIRRLGLSAGEGSTVVVARGLLNAAVPTLGALCGLAFSSRSPEIGSWKLLAAALAAGGIWGLITFLIRRWRTGETDHMVAADEEVERIQESGWRAKISYFFKDMWNSFVLLWRREHRMILIYSAVLMVVYWAFRLSFGPLALMASGWSGDWAPVVLAQLYLTSFVLPFAPTPGGSGAAELGFAGFLTAYATNNQVISGVVIYAGLTHYLPTVVGALFTGSQLWQGVTRGE